MTKKRESRLRLIVGLATVISLGLAPWATFGMGETSLFATIFLSAGGAFGGLANWANSELSDMLAERNVRRRKEEFGEDITDLDLECEAAKPKRRVRR